MDKKDFKERTKHFALEVIKIAENLPREEQRIFLEGNWLRQGLPCGQIIGLLAERNQLQIIYPRWASWKKKLMKVYFGWSFLLKPV